MPKELVCKEQCATRLRIFTWVFGGAVSNAPWNNHSGWTGMMGQAVGPGGASSTKGTGWDSAMGSMITGSFVKWAPSRPERIFAERDRR